MAIKEVRREWDECQLDYTKEFILHTEADVSKLPKCCTGSTAIVSETGNVYTVGKDKAWKKREEAMKEAGNTPSGGSGMPSGDAPHQMLVTDAEGAAKWEDRTHYTVVTDAEILPSSEMISMGDEGFVSTDPISQLPSPGASCVITWNGVEYGCVAEEMDMGFSTPAILLGNTSVAEGAQTTNDPFVVILVPPEDVATVGIGAMAMPLDGSTAVTIAVTGQIETVKQLDKKFIPEMPERDELLIVAVTYDSSTRTSVADHTFEEMRTAYDKGKMLFCYRVEETGAADDPHYWYSLSYFDGSEFYFVNSKGSMPETLKINQYNYITLASEHSLSLQNLQVRESGGLTLCAEDGTYYKLVVSADGTLSAVKT